MQKTIAPVKAILFDFDGTLSTLRGGWESVMRPLMLEMIDPEHPKDPALCAMVDAYIDASTGVQTIFQMQWLRETVQKRGGEALDAWAYKDLYNERLMQTVSRRVADVQSGRVARDAYLVRGAEALLQALSDRDVAMYVASGTDDADVKREAAVLGLAGFFQRIDGAPHRRADCSKEAVLRALMQEEGLVGREMAVIGDGRVEIALGREAGARTLGVAPREAQGEGMDPQKEKRLEKAGADRIVRDFADVPDILRWLGL